MASLETQKKVVAAYKAAFPDVLEGVAPLYRNWPLEVGILDEADRVVTLTRPSVDLRRWLPGPWAGAAQPSRFANTLPVVRGGWTELTTL